MPPTILCLGDSHTRGLYGSDWVTMLERALGEGGGGASSSAKTKLIRKGVDGQLSNNINARAAGAIADATSSAAQPLSAVVLFCGTNDALCCSSKDWRDFHARVTKFLKPGEEVTADTFEASVRRMVETSVAGGAGASSSAPAPAPAPAVALVTLPPLDEHDLQSNNPSNAIVRELNRRLQKIAAEFPDRVTLIDLFAACERDLRQNPPPSRAVSAPEQQQQSHAPKAMVRLGAVCLARRWLLRQSWDKVAAANGGRLLTDRIHLSDAAGRLLCDALLPWARKATVGAAATTRA
jgi:lysophospholipase L1-like esterase